MYWDLLKEEKKSIIDYGFCRRHAPVAVTIAKAAEFEARWPMTYESEWCGEHRWKPRQETDRDEVQLVATKFTTTGTGGDRNRG
ncbi:MAG: hypothetical protein HQL34_05270 [Alphaproteobacteria bacterium]|nr:hypothetical protein [Alphaproteobacteria bacterium]